eukprot:CAMPEP_0202357512 /NCGR_PEP_ID=MMETSP1126-20121109/11511_1 /ASSEMBLY_ACC=CAM_ASM_000457 /TAXON_ID=3047 /ORGANISM="Dunaliella tertiolecta, Strain CCMP1320" /LENGTH=272 /DNA_ID=CAMNT_0048950411 /DNA_START=242 /DNA_END=1060 /DNA_ORIENTATION=+
MSTAAYFYCDKRRLQEFLLMVQQDPSGSLHLFMAAYTLSVVLLFPCMIMQVISGALYGFTKGFMVSWVSTSTGQALAFLLGRYLFRPTVKAYLHSTWPTFPTIDHAIKREGWKLVCLLRLSPVLPYNVLNYALAITPVPLWIFTLGSAVAAIPWTALYVYLGTFSTNLVDLAQGKIEYQGGTHVLVRILSGVLIALTTVYGYMLSQRAIHAVLKNASGASLGANGGKDGEAGSLKGGGSNSSNGSCPQTPLTRSMSLSMTTIVEHRDLESGN